MKLKYTYLRAALSTHSALHCIEEEKVEWEEGLSRLNAFHFQILKYVGKNKNILQNCRMMGRKNDDRTKPDCLVLVPARSSGFSSQAGGGSMPEIILIVSHGRDREIGRITQREKESTCKIGNTCVINQELIKTKIEFQTQKLSRVGKNGLKNSENVQLLFIF